MLSCHDVSPCFIAIFNAQELALIINQNCVPGSSAITCWARSNLIRKVSFQNRILEKNPTCHRVHSNLKPSKAEGVFTHRNLWNAPEQLKQNAKCCWLHNPGTLPPHLWLTVVQLPLTMNVVTANDSGTKGRGKQDQVCGYNNSNSNLLHCSKNKAN